MVHHLAVIMVEKVMKLADRKVKKRVPVEFLVLRLVLVEFDV